MKELNRKINQYDSQGQKHGVWEKYNKDGSLWQKEYYIHGKEHGVQEYYFANGLRSLIYTENNEYHTIHSDFEKCFPLFLSATEIHLNDCFLPE